jgi:hypothetical protein
VVFGGGFGARLYSVVGWGDFTSTATVTRVRAAEPLRAIVSVRKGQRRDWRPIAVFEGEPKLVASWPELVGRIKAIESRSAEIYTVVGFWLASGEAAVKIVEAGGGVVACLLFAAQLGESEVQVLSCFRGQPLLVITAENLPTDL